MGFVRDEFYVNLLSSSSMEISPGNTQSRFQNFFKNPITLEGEWSVGVTEFYHNAYNNDSVTNTSQVLYIHSDIIASRLVGDQCARIIRVVHTHNREECVRFSHIEYMPVMSGFHMSSVSILITTNDNEQPNFKSSLSPTMVTLHFKRYK